MGKRNLFGIVLAWVLAVAGVSSGVAYAQPQLDPFLCYRVKPSKGSEKFAPIPHLTLTDQFESRAASALRPLLLCNPAQVGESTISDPAVHLEGYQLKPFRNICIDTAPANVGRECKNERDCGGTPRETDFCQAAPKHTKLSKVRVVNQFGDIQVDTINPETLLVPTATCSDTPGEACPDPLPPPDPASHHVDHYECYTVKLSAGEEKFPQDLHAQVIDQFSQSTLYDIQKPTALCNPVDKNGEGINDLDTHLMCYEAVVVPKICAATAPANPNNACKAEEDCGGVARQSSFCQPQAKPDKVSGNHTNNQFGPEQLDTLKVEELCTPSQKIIDPPLPNQPPTASFTAVPDSGDKPLQVSFSASTSSDSDGLIVSYRWDFGDGQSGSGKTTSHTYVSKGTFTVTLTVLDNRHGTATASHMVEVKDSPPPPPSPFTITAAPDTAEVIQGQTVSYAVTLNSTKGFAQLAALGVAGLPTGVSGAFKPKQLAVGQTSLLTLIVPGDQTPGTIPLSVSAVANVNGETVTTSANLTLNVLPITTSFLGRTVVDDALQTPLAGVTVTMLGVDGANQPTGCTGHSTVSDAAGNFMFTNLPPECTGGQLIRYNGTTATAPPGDYAGVDLFYNIVANQVTTSPVLIHLPRTDDKEVACVKQNAPTDQNFTFKTIPHLSVTVYAGTTFAPNDNYPPPAGRCAAGEFPLIAINVPVDRLPDEMPPDPNNVMPFIVAFQPANTVASQPVAVYFPNLLNTPPGTPMQLSTLDPTKGVMVIYGTGTVSPDGTQVIPDLDPAHAGHRYGLVHFDWHGAQTQKNDKDPSPECQPQDPHCLCTQAGDPVDLSSGLVVLQETDITTGGPLGVSVVRTYRNLARPVTPIPPPFGLGGSHNFAYRLNTNAPVSSAVIDLIMPDGSQFSFAQQGNNIWINTSIPALRGAVMVAAHGGIDLHWKDGTTFHFEPSTFQVGSVLTSVSDTNGNLTRILHESSSHPERVTHIIDPVGRSLFFSYESHGYISGIIDPLGRTVGYGYSTREFSDAHVLTQVIYPDGKGPSYAYDSFGIGSVGNIPLFSSVLTRIIDQRGVTVATNAYDDKGRVIEQLRPDGSRIRFDYTPLNPLALFSPILETKVTDARGQITTYRFSPQGFLLNVTDPLGQTKIFERGGNNLVQAMRGNGICGVCGDPGAGDVSFSYDGDGNLTARTDARGKTTRFAYFTVTDPELGFPRFTRLDSLTDPLGNITGFTYDANGNLTERIDANGHSTRLSYNGRGLPTGITDPLSHHTTLAYDGFGNLTAITDPLGHTTSIQYDAVSRPIGVTDALGRKASTVYDELDQVKTRTNAQNGVTQFIYDEVGNLKSLIDPLNHATTFTYDEMNRLVTRTTPLGKVDTRHYDANGNLDAFVDRRRQGSEFAYDELNRLIGEFYSDGTVTRSYDAQSRLIRVEDALSGDFTFAYDDVGRTTSATTQFGAVEYTYDDVGQVLSRQVMGQAPVNYHYDPVGNLLDATLALTRVDFAYDDRDQLLTLTRSNGVSSSYDYDPVGRVLSLIHAKGNTVLNSQTYKYDEVGNRTNYETNIAQPLITQPFRSGNYDNDNKLLSNNDKTFTYDDNGNVTTETGPEGTTTYTWDSRNRLKSLALPNGQTINFLYDFAGNMIRKQVSGGGPTTSQEFVLDDLRNISYQKSSNGSAFSTLTGQSIDEHFAIIGSGGQVNFGLTDTVNSTTATTNQDGVLGSQFFYEPFGQTTTSSDYPFQFTGRVSVTNSLYYYRARFYHPTLGRFISEDAASFAAGDVNLYRYVENGPVNGRDPAGLKGLKQFARDYIADLKIIFDYFKDDIIDYLLEQIDENAKKVWDKKKQIEEFANEVRNNKRSHERALDRYIKDCKKETQRGSGQDPDVTDAIGEFQARKRHTLPLGKQRILDMLARTCKVAGVCKFREVE